MKRHTQTQQAAAAAAARPERPAADLARPAETAAALIALAMSESQRPVAALGQALARIAAAVAAGEPPRAADIAACIESLQFHDRMIQQLTHVRDLLANVAAVPEEDTAGWPALRETLRARFTSESHRMLFNLLLPDEIDHGHIRLHADEGSVELF